MRRAMPARRGRRSPCGTSVQRRRIVGIALAIVATVGGSAAPTPAAESNRPEVILEPVVVTATRLPESLADVPASVSVIDRDDIHGGRPTVGLDETLDRVPGVFVQNNRNFAQDLRIQIRGFGTRAAFGIREIKVLVDGLPETLPDGQTEIDALDLAAIDHIEVLRGPASSLYGNAAGGVIQLFTDDPPPAPEARVRLTGGSYGLGKYDVHAGARSGDAGVALHAGFVQLGGYREHSTAERGTMTAKLTYALGTDTDVMLLLNGLDTPRADDPGGLTREEVRADRRQARQLNVDLDAGEHVSQGRVGAVVRHRSGVGEISAYTYVIYRDFDGRLPILPSAGDGITAFTRVSPGGGVRWAGHAELLGCAHTLLVGVDVQDQDDDRHRFANVGGARGGLHLAQDEHVTGVGPYLRWIARLRDDLEVSAGARYDRVHYDVDVHVPADSGGSSTRTLDAWSPGGGITWRPRAWLSVFANVATAFETPTTTELANPDGPGFNPNLEPQKSISYEVGARAHWPARATVALSAFYLDLEKTLIPFESASGRTFFRNAGRSERYGVEAEWQWQLSDELRMSAALTFIHAEFRRYRTGGANLAGNEEPGIPAGIAYGEVSYRHPGGLYGALEASVESGFYADDANTVRESGNSVVNLRGGYDGRFGRIRVEPFVGIENVTDTAYDGVVRSNAAAGRFFEPAPGINVYGGVALRFES